MEDIKKIYLPSLLAMLVIYLHLYFSADLVAEYLGHIFTLIITPLLIFVAMLIISNKLTNDNWKVVKKSRYKIISMLIVVYLPVLHLVIAILVTGEV